MDYHNKLTEYIMWSLEYHILNFFSGPIAVYCARRVCGGDAAQLRRVFFHRHQVLRADQRIPKECRNSWKRVRCTKSRWLWRSYVPSGCPAAKSPPKSGLTLDCLKSFVGYLTRYNNSNCVMCRRRINFDKQHNVCCESFFLIFSFSTVKNKKFIFRKLFISQRRRAGVF